MKKPRKPKVSDTPETDAQRITDLNVALRLDATGHWTGDTNVEVVSAEFARQLERDRNHMSKAAAEWMRSWREIHDRVTQAEVAAEQARELARNLYWAGWDLRRFARAYANGYDEADGKAGAIAADYAFYEASQNIGEILGEATETPPDRNTETLSPVSCPPSPDS